MPLLYDEHGQPTGCKGPWWYLGMWRQLRDSLTPEEPECERWCKFCRATHVVRAERLIAGPTADPQRRRRLAPSRSTNPNFCTGHRTSSTWLTSPCAYCGSDRVHIHLDALGPARKGQAQEPCPQCRRMNGILVNRGAKVWALKRQPRAGGVVKAVRLEGGKPVGQLTLLR